MTSSAKQLAEAPGLGGVELLIRPLPMTITFQVITT
jgi:hypothetical protein